MNAPSEAELVVRLSLRSLLPLVVISAALFVGCGGGGGGGSTPGRWRRRNYSYGDANATTEPDRH